MSAAACSAPQETGDGVDEPEPEPEPEPQGVVTLADAPPPISGGTMAITADDRFVVAADSDRDRIWVVDLQAQTVVGHVPLATDDEPGRVLVGTSGRAHVALRNGGAISTIDVASASLVTTTPVCPAPRGLAQDPDRGLLHVACAGGELVTLDEASLREVARVQLERDLRDVAVHGEQLLVTSFRAAQILVVEGGEVIRRLSPPSARVVEDTFIPRVAWRLLPLNGGVALLHQRAQETEVELGPNAYQDGVCSGAVAHGTITLFSESMLAGEAAPIVPTYVPDAVLPVDAAVSPDGKTVSIVSAGNDVVVRMQRALFESAKPCGWAGLEMQTRKEHVTDVGQPVAVAYDSTGRLLVQSREPALISIGPRDGQAVKPTPIELPGESRRDTGHDLFHRAPDGAIIACASCHAEGGDDGHTWKFIPDGIRRTQHLRGGLLDRAPFHWSGDLLDFPHLVDDTFVKRMGGPELDDAHLQAFVSWIEAIPLIPFQVTDAAAVERGAEVFTEAKCTACHAGHKLTSKELKDVGTGGTFKVPALLNLPFRAPFMHNGCANTLAARFDDECGGELHGSADDLTPEQVADIVAYMESISATR